MALIQNTDYVINIDKPEVSAFSSLANNHNVGMLFLGTHNYLFNIEVFDFEATFSSQYFQGQTYFIQENMYFVEKIEGKPIPEAIVDMLNDPDADTQELERFLLATIAERGNQQKQAAIGGEYIDINRCKKFVVKKMWIGGGSISFKYPEDTIQKQIPIVKASDAKLLKAFYTNDMKS